MKQLLLLVILLPLATATKYYAISGFKIKVGPNAVKECFNEAPPNGPKGTWNVAGRNTNEGNNGVAKFLCYHYIEVDPNDMPTTHILSDIMVLSHPDKTQLRCPRGYQKLDSDLSEGAGGNFVFLCFKLDIQPQNWVQWISVRWTDNDYPNGFNIIHSNLNQGNSGKALYVYYKPMHKQYITNVQVVYDKSDYHAKRRCISKGKNWYLGGFNTNQGTGSDYYIYLCMEKQFAPINRKYLIDARIVTSKESSVSCGHGFDRINFDLSAGAGGDYVFFCGRWSDSAKNTVTDLVVRPPSFSLSLVNHESYSKDQNDLNNRAGGDYLHLFYLKR